MYKAGTLKEPTNTDIVIEENDQQGQETYTDEDEEVEYQIAIEELVNIISKELLWQKGDWVAVRYEKYWYPGEIIEVRCLMIINTAIEYIKMYIQV